MKYFRCHTVLSVSAFKTILNSSLLIYSLAGAYFDIILSSLLLSLCKMYESSLLGELCHVVIFYFSASYTCEKICQVRESKMIYRPAASRNIPVCV